MPTLNFSQVLTANQLGYNPFANWQHQYTEGPAHVRFMVRGTGVSGRLTLYASSETIVERSPIQGGGTAGTTPSELNTAQTEYDVPGGVYLKAAIDEVSGLTPTIDGVIRVDYY